MDTVSPASVGLSSTRLQRIGQVMQRYVDRGQIAGLLTLVARHGRVAHLECFGRMDIEADKPMRPDAIFRIYSMSKPVTSVALMMLYEEGLFQLDDPLSSYIPAFRDMQVCVGGTVEAPQLAPAERGITIHHLLTHTSGLCYPDPAASTAERLLARAGEEQEKATDPNAFTLAQFVPWLAGQPLVCQPGRTWHYGFSTDVVGHLVEVLSGQPFDVYLREHIFAPLGMADTGFYVPPEKVGRFTAMYAATEQGGLELLDAPATGEYARPRPFLSGGGGLVSTAGDYLRFAQMLLNRGELDGVRLLGRKTVDLMTRNHLPPALLPYGFPGQPWLGLGFGLGFRVVMDTAQAGIAGSEGQYGWSGLASTDYWADPQEELIGLVMPQFISRFNINYPLHLQFRVLTYQALED